jgi:hypothetical protein
MLHTRLGLPHLNFQIVSLHLWPTVATPLWVKCEDETHTPKSGNLESPGTPENSEFEFRGQNTLHWGFLYTIGKVLKCRCPKWPCMSHLDAWSSSYGQKKGRESNWQFDSRPLKVRNRPEFDVYRRSATWRRATRLLQTSSQLEVWARSYGCPKSQESKSGQFRDSSLGVLGKSAIRMWFRQRAAKNIIRGKVVASPESRPWWVNWVQGRPWLVPTPKGCRMSSNQLVVGFGCKTE